LSWILCSTTESLKRWFSVTLNNGFGYTNAGRRNRTTPGPKLLTN